MQNTKHTEQICSGLYPLQVSNTADINVFIMIYSKID